MASTSRLILVGGAVACALAAGAWFWWQQQAQPAVAPPAAPAARTAPEPPPPPAPEFGAPAPAPAPLEARDVPAAVQSLFGPAGGRLLQLDDFARRFVATVDNLGREHAPSQVWPVQKPGTRFEVDAGAIAAANAARYAPYVDALEHVDTARAVELYARLYPLLQAAYRQLGFAQGEFNARLLRVLDLLVAAPEPQAPVEVQLLEVKGPVAPEQPWTRYEFRDPQLQALAAGQKMMVRMGLDNERRTKAKLRELRAAIAAASTRRN